MVLNYFRKKSCFKIVIYSCFLGIPTYLYFDSSCKKPPPPFSFYLVMSYRHNHLCFSDAGCGLSPSAVSLQVCLYVLSHSCHLSSNHCHVASAIKKRNIVKKRLLLHKHFQPIVTQKHVEILT